MEPDSENTTEQAEPSSKLLAYVQLFRLPNVFTAIADVLMGYLFVQPTLDPPQLSIALVLGSALMYTAGMVLNDVFDVDVDRAERPERPLPSGRIAVGWARWLGFEMLFFGTALGCVASLISHDPRCACVAVGLAVLILFYNRVLKATLLGPIAMGGCRFLNVLLGMSAAGAGVAWTGTNYLIAAGIGIYIVGVSWFARGEADEEIHRGPLIAGTFLMAVGILLLASYPNGRMAGSKDIVAVFHQYPENLAWLLLAITIFFRCIRAILRPYAVFVEEAVKYCLMSLITFDTIITFVQHQQNIWWAAIIFALVLPMTLLGRWSYST